nr:MFS transporter [Kibdelosporangium sp. MJ126-NF4]CEL18099.1 major facilitator superfamily MFS_1 [Kibdelosporangium sp. MJ126-NF4]CTQ90672.1 major facilitator superfamily MFS_1 [Kibdelosporangium sp. MJ126-NF4]
MSLLRHRDFRLLWASDTVSQFSTFVAQTVMPLLAATALMATPFEMGLLTAAETAAFLLIGLPAGAWVDRMRRRPLMVGANVVRTVLLLSIPMAWWTGLLTLSQMIVVALVAGVCAVFFDVSYQSYLPTLVGREQLLEGNAKLQTSQSAAQVTGPALGGVLTQLVGAATAISVLGLGYAASALSLLRITRPEPKSASVPAHRLRAEIGEGLRFVYGNPIIRAIALTGGTVGFFQMMETASMVLFLTRDLGLSSSQVGLVLAAGGIGGGIGAATSGRWYRRIGHAKAMWVPIVLLAPFELLIPLAQPGWRIWLVVVGIVGVNYLMIVQNVAQVSFRQSVCPDRLLGRMNASMRFVMWGVFPFGALAGGTLGELIGVRGTLWVAACGLSVSGVWLMLSPLRTIKHTTDAHHDLEARPTRDTAASR